MAAIRERVRSQPESVRRREKPRLSRLRSVAELNLAVGVSLMVLAKTQLRADHLEGDLNWREYNDLSPAERAAYDAERAAAYRDRAQEEFADGNADAARTSMNTTKLFRWRG